MSKLTKKKKSFSNLTPTPAIGMIPTSPGSVPLAPSGYMNTPNNGVSIPEYQKQQLSRREAEHLMQSDRFTPVVMLPEELFNPHMGSYNSIYAASTYQFAQNNPDPLINSRGYEIFQEMLTMAACRGPFNQKRYDVLSLPGKTIPCITDPDDPNYEQAQEYAEFCDWCIKNIKDKADNNQDFRLVLFEVLMACWEGFHVTDIIYRILPHGPYKGKVGYSYFASKPAKEIGWQLDYETLAPMNIMPYTPLTGYESPKAIESSLIYTYDPQEGLPYGSGDGRACW